ncbi:MAG TPA: 2-keto-4-pentenoate hydratase [Thermohalobaculum sp.]|nr:2-keto-4-pentenoate hydratase [Thermohalobaculum sp.]
MPSDAEHNLAQALIEARRSGRKVGLDAIGGGPADAAAAYRIQAEVARAVGPVAAWKTGRKSPGGEQTLAPIFAGTVRQSPASFGADELWLIGIELEIAFRVEKPLPPVGAPDFEARARGCVSAVAAIEVVDTRLADHQAAGPLAKLADNQINAGLVIGSPRADWQGLDLTTPQARLTFGGEAVIDGPRQVPGGDAFATFCTFARMVGEQCGGLQVGQCVTTGSLNGLPFIERGTRVAGWIEGLGEVAVDFPA